MGLVRGMMIEQADGSFLQTHISDFASMLSQSVAAGASIGFVQPFSPSDATEFWLSRVLPQVQDGSSVLFAARLGEDGPIAGTAQLVLPTMPNQAHKADVAKMMVHPDYRRRGIAGGLLTALIHEAQRRSFRLLTLDTRTNDSAQPLYAKFGFEVAGEIPGFAIDPDDPEKLDGTTYMYKWLGSAVGVKGDNG